jgi:hypothetical protein
MPSLSAVTTAVPGATPWTSPAFVTTAIDDADEDHTTVRPERVAPFASFKVTVARCDCPATREDEGSTTETDATGAVDGFAGSTTDVP